MFKRLTELSNCRQIGLNAFRLRPMNMDGNGRGPAVEPGGGEPPSLWKTYRCSRPLNQPGSKEPCSGEKCHEYLCASKNGKIVCVGLSHADNGIPWLPDWVAGPGVNNKADQYNEENCSEVSSSPCINKCVNKKFKEPLPIYGYGPQGTDCHEWAGDTLDACEKECKGAG